MKLQQRLFTRELIHKVNENMIARRPPDLSGLPADVSDSIRGAKFSREEINRAFTDARRRITEAA